MVLFFRSRGFDPELGRAPRDTRLPKGVWRRMTSTGKERFYLKTPDKGRLQLVDVQFDEDGPSDADGEDAADRERDPTAEQAADQERVELTA